MEYVCLLSHKPTNLFMSFFIFILICDCFCENIYISTQGSDSNSCTEIEFPCYTFKGAFNKQVYEQCENVFLFIY
jgi:hypothetical protein